MSEQVWRAVAYPRENPPHSILFADNSPVAQSLRQNEQMAHVDMKMLAEAANQYRQRNIDEKANKEAPEVKPGVYQHYKGQFYHVMGMCAHTETKEKLVLYTPMYNHPSGGPVYQCRPAQDWFTLLGCYEERLQHYYAENGAAKIGPEVIIKTEWETAKPHNPYTRWIKRFSPVLGGHCDTANLYGLSKIIRGKAMWWEDGKEFVVRESSFNGKDFVIRVPERLRETVKTYQDDEPVEVQCIELDLHVSYLYPDSLLSIRRV